MKIGLITIHVCIEDAASEAIDAACKLSFLNDKNVDDFNTFKKILDSLKKLIIFLQKCQRSVILIFITIE